MILQSELLCFFNFQQNSLIWIFFPTFHHADTCITTTYPPSLPPVFGKIKIHTNESPKRQSVITILYVYLKKLFNMESTFQVNLFIIRVNTLYIPVYNKSSMHIRAKHAQLSVTYRRHN